MNNFKNYRSSNLNPTPKTPSTNSDVPEEPEKTHQNNTKFEGNKLVGALNIFLESEKFNLERSRKEVGRKGDAPHTEKSENAGKPKKEGKKIKRKEVTSAGKPEESVAEDEPKIAEGPKPEVEKAPANSLFTMVKEEQKKKGAPKPEGNVKQIVFRANVEVQPQIKPPPKPAVVQSIEVKPTVSETKKNRINEILKGHAQKFQQAFQVKGLQNKDYSFQGVTELLQKVQNISKAVKEDTCKKDGKVQKEETTTKPEKEEPGQKNSAEIKKIEFTDGPTEDRKKTANKWIKYPQSNELERRLKTGWQEGVAFPPDKQTPTSGTEEEESKSSANTESGTSSDKEKEEEKKEDKDKRTTYIDRLLSAKIAAKEKEQKEKEQKKSRGGESRKDSRKDGKDKKDGDGPKTNFSKNHNEHKIIDFPKDLPLLENREMIALREGRHTDIEPIYKAKVTRSTELRDLVSQAIKDHKIFCIFDNHWYIVRPVREELLSRGWLEVIPDRRLIPRRRPPPMGPTFDREKSTIDHTIEAILSAKETFADEIQESVSKSASFRSTFDRPRVLPITAPHPTKKLSNDSLNEVLSQFRIIPPTAEKKKNNFEIRDFVARCQSHIEKIREHKEKGREREREKPKTVRKEKPKQWEPTRKVKSIEPEPEKPAVNPKNLQEIIDTINDNKKTLLRAASEIEDLDVKAGINMKALEAQVAPDKKAANLVGKALPALESKEASEKAGKNVKDSKSLFSESESKAISKIITSNNSRIHFMWLSIKPSIHLKCFNYSPEIVNKFQKTTFCTKIGLWNHLNNIQWYAHEVHFPAKSPRMYNTGEADDLQAFFLDFQLTACIGMLKWLSDTFFDRGIKAVQAKKGKVPLRAFEFAIKQCEKYMRFKDNEDLGILEEQRVLQEEWNTFLQWFYIITNDHGKVQESSSAQLMVVYTKAVETLRAMKKHWPEMDIDGRLNIWIMKPYCASCGRGIFMTNNVYYIGQHTKYIVQKYIERPLLIYNTKFDIRQWFMITKLTPLEIWMYKECYLRFCTQPFALRNLHESVHLSNNSVQRKYVSYRDPSLPDQNMWDSNTFQLYLKTIGHSTVWQDIIYPGMKDAIVSTMLAAQDTFDSPRKNWFEVYGADFMLSANLKDGPWLIEINENPAMDPSTKVTARLCPQMLRDVIKVVVDKRANKSASTGQWELIYRQNYSPSYGTVDLDVRGKKIARVPHTVKVSLNQQSSASQLQPRQWLEETAATKLYEVVKSFHSGQNSKGDADFVLHSFGKAKEKRNKLSSNSKFTKDKTKQQVHYSYHNYNYMHLEDKTSLKAPEEEKHGRGMEVAKAEVKSDDAVDRKDKRDSKQREDKNSMAVLSTGRMHLKRMRNCSLSRDPPKRTNLGSGMHEPKNNTSTSDSQFPATDTKKPEPSKPQSSYQAEKFKFTKFYKV